MILADTSIWIDHLRAGETGLVSLLNDNQVLTHPMVIGELACGNLHNRDAVLGLLGGLPAVTAATDEEVLFFIKERRMMGLGIWVHRCPPAGSSDAGPVGPALDAKWTARRSGGRSGSCLRDATGAVAPARPSHPSRDRCTTCKHVFPATATHAG